MHNTESILENETHEFFVILKYNGSLNFSQTTRPSDSQQKKRTCRIVDFVVPAHCGVNVKGSKKRDNNQYLARVQKNYGT